MPAVSKAQRVAAAIAEHEPEKLYARNKGMATMGKKELHMMASTPEKGLPARRKISQSKRSMRDRSTAASPPMSTKEIMCGYRKMK